MNSSKAEAENIEPSAGKELLDKYWVDVKNEIDDINIVSHTNLFDVLDLVVNSILVHTLLACRTR
jgi:hypothetical protein